MDNLGLPIFIWGGIILFIMTIFQILVAKRILPIDFKYHRINGYLILVFGLIHGLLAMGWYLSSF